ncbi:MAG: PEP-CTERM sorting domain-containing protein [Proteobacteria bacterium]|nr:PEP-CTERM sorting domain-containing protein [Pseudomonadota bacterium]
MKKMLKIAAALAVIGAASQAHAGFSAQTVTIDPDGAGGAFGDISVTSLNWLAGNAVTVGAGGSTGQTIASLNSSLSSGTAVFQSYYQAQLNTFVYNNGGSSSTYTPVGQWTVQASFQEAATATSVGAANISLSPISGTVSIYYNAVQTANDITGTGYSDGIKILQGTIVGGSGTFQNTTFINDLLVSLGLIPSNPTPITDLDHFGANDAPGIKSIQGNGQSSLVVDIGASVGDFIDSNFFKTNITSMSLVDGGDVSDTGQLVDPFSQANPSDQIVGYTPQYGGALGDTNGVIAANDGTTFSRNSDFQFQTTNVTSFQYKVPEPGSLALVGLGFALTGALRRRKA